MATYYDPYLDYRALRLGNYVQVKNSTPAHYVRITTIALMPGYSDYCGQPAHAVMTFSLPTQTSDSHLKPLLQLEAIPLTPNLLLQLGFVTIPASHFPTESAHVYQYPGPDADTKWVVSFEGKTPWLWMVLDGENRSIADVHTLHHLQNLIYFLDNKRELRFEGDKIKIML